MAAHDGQIMSLGVPAPVSGEGASPFITQTGFRIDRYTPLEFVVTSGSGSAKLSDLVILVEQGGVFEMAFLHGAPADGYLQSSAAIDPGDAGSVQVRLKRRQGWTSTPRVRVHAWGFEP